MHMWKNLKSFLEADATLEYDASGSPSSEEQIIAVLAIALKAARIDGSLGGFELDRAVEAIAQEFEKDDAAIRHAVDVADFLAKDTKKLSSLIESIRDRFNEAQKVEILAVTWKVLKADSKIEKSEAQFGAELRTLLGLTVEQALFAQKK